MMESNEIGQNGLGKRDGKVAEGIGDDLFGMQADGTGQLWKGSGKGTERSGELYGEAEGGRTGQAG